MSHYSLLEFLIPKKSFSEIELVSFQLLNSPFLTTFFTFFGLVLTVKRKEISATQVCFFCAEIFFAIT